MNSVIDIRDLQVRKGEKTICRVPQLQVAAGERVGIVGPNGSGKTTLLRVIASFEKEYNGQCRVEVSPCDRVFVHQSPYLFRGTVMFNATYGLAAHGAGRPEQLNVARDWLALLGVDHLRGRPTTTLSGGERRRVALARAFALQPDVLLLDEPLADLDEEGIDIVCRAMDRLLQSTILIASPVSLPANLPARIHAFGRDDGPNF